MQRHFFCKMLILLDITKSCYDPLRAAASHCEQLRTAANRCETAARRCEALRATASKHYYLCAAYERVDLQKLLFYYHIFYNHNFLSYLEFHWEDPGIRG